MSHHHDEDYGIIGGIRYSKINKNTLRLKYSHKTDRWYLSVAVVNSEKIEMISKELAKIFLENNMPCDVL